MRQNEAMLNELKGNLFEFLFAQKIAQKNHIESSFLKSLHPEIHGRLREYQSLLASLNPILYSSLPILLNLLVSDLDLKDFEDITEIKVIGKLSEGSFSKKKIFAETDVLLLQNEIPIPVSLKLSKDNAFVNTKSAGVKSFFSKYFSIFPESTEIQNNLTLWVEEVHLRMVQALYNFVGLEFRGGFDEQWKEANLPLLPGELSPDLNEIVLKSYHEIIRKIYDHMSFLFNRDRSKFSSSLLPLLGFGRSDLRQIICFYTKSNQGLMEYKGHFYLSKRNLFDEAKEICLNPLKNNLSSFEISLDDFSLQIRVKPMNNFMAISPKINCSLKKRKKS